MRLIRVIAFSLAAASAFALYGQNEDSGEETVQESNTEEKSVSIGGVLDIVHAEGNHTRLNNNTLGDNNFNSIRSLLNVRFEQSDRISADIEVLFDDASQDRIRLQGAFVTLLNLPDERVNIMVGKIPNLFGNFARRQFSDVNPLIGQPLVRHYRTSLDWNNLWDNREQLILKRRRQEFNGDIPIKVLEGATPTVYDARWDIGLELFGSWSFFEYQMAVTEGSISNPEADLNKGKQFLGRFGIQPWPGLRVGVSGAVNPYLSNADDQRLLESGKGKGEFMQRAVGADLEFSYRYVMVFGEFVHSSWDATVIEDRLSNWSWYADAKLKIHPRAYLAARYDRMAFSKILNPDTGKKEGWDYDVQRVEAGLGWRITSEATLKMVEQITWFDNTSGLNTLYTTAVQLSVPF